MRYCILILLMFPVFCLAQNIPRVNGPVPVYNHPKRSTIPDDQIGKYKYVWYIVYPDNVIRNVQTLGGTCPKEWGPLTESECMGSIQDCAQEGMKLGYSKRLNPRYNPPKNGSAEQSAEQDNWQESGFSKEGEYTYDPLEDAVNKATQSKKKLVNNDPNVVDLSGLKDSYSAKVNPLELKSAAQVNTSKEKCQEALNYAANRIRALNQLINNSGKLIEQQNRTIETAKKNLDDWNDIVFENNWKIAQDVTDIGTDILGKKLGDKSQLSDKYGLFENGANITSLGADIINGKANHPYADGFLTTMNALDGMGLFETIKPIHYTLLGAPLVADVSFGALAYKPMSQHAREDLNQVMSDLDSLKSKIESWKEELKELKDCGNNCDLIRRVMIKHRPDLR